ncbi:Uncharacterized protein PA52Ts2_p0002 (plasmid) [Pseudomonas aeruginosa]|nr:Uncharacterized protein PA52Ts1_p0002 [Pseudomonas aeruginosa]QJE87793.1 Uncharacterized protein PA52Ts2_p0002 [Pseudomonas aeruginosa]QJE94218.1 Uncharacterized protein PA52Ts17_p0002 [Pseudomonas aeruginosa]QLJ85899.1 Uncharacterized protein PA52Ts32_p0003 [Pseudomonas aeruginosa]
MRSSRPLLVLSRSWKRLRRLLSRSRRGCGLSSIASMTNWSPRQAMGSPKWTGF